MTAEPPEPPEPAARGARDVLLRWGLLALVLVAFAIAVGDRWTDVRDSLSSLSVGALIGSLALATVGLLGPWYAWVAVTSDLGMSVPWRTSARMFFVSQLGKYVPGAVWPVVMQMRVGRELGISRTRIAVSFLVTLALGVGTGLVVGGLALPALARNPQHSYVWLAVLLPLAAVALHPRVLNAGTRLVLRVTRRPGQAELSTRGVLRAVTGTCAFWLIGGLHLWLLVVGLGADPLTSLPVSIGALALAVSVGPLLVVLPAGAGFREAVLVAALSSLLPVPAALAAALVSRAVLVAGDGLLAAWAAVVGRPGEPGRR